MANIKIKAELDKSMGQQIQARCIQCKCDTVHRVLQSIDVSQSEIVGFYRESHPETFWADDSYQIIQCQGCESVSFRHVSSYSEDEVMSGPDQWEYVECIRLYPERLRRSRAAQLDLMLPPNVDRIYSEAIQCFNNGAPTLCAVGMRAMIEGICADQGVVNGPVLKPDGTTKQNEGLEGKINGLSTKGIVTQRDATALHQLRFFGNDAVHELLEPSYDDLDRAFEILEHTLESLYVIPDKADQMTRNRERRKNK